MKPYIAQITSNLRLMGRDRPVLFFSYMFPLVFFFIFAQMMSGRQSAAAMAQVIAMVIIIGVLGNGFFGEPIASATPHPRANCSSIRPLGPVHPKSAGQARAPRDSVISRTERRDGWILLAAAL